MVKADYTRDYYADLDLPQTADVNEVKKQFRKLALKYHPDRNPGRESEVNSKFQTIQTAHEILSSPESKAKYDANRSRHGRFPTSSGVRGNPWQDMGKDFPPPPQRNNNTRSNTSSRSSASAARYAKFPMNTPPPPPPRPTDKDDAQSRADAFESMRSHARKAAPTAPQPNSSSAGASSTRARPPPPDPRQTAYTASQQKKAEASFGTRTPRASRSGFVPGSPMGDEAPVPSKHYATKRHTSLFEDTASAYQKPQASASSSDHNDGGPRPYLDPRSSPYGGVRGEKFDPFSGVPNLGQTRSTREIPRKPVGADPSDAFGATNYRQRSFSVSDDADSPPKAPEARRGSEANPGRAHYANTSARMPSSPTTSRFGERYTPKLFQGSDETSSSGGSTAANFGSDKAKSTAGRANSGQHNVYPAPGHRSAESLATNANESRFMRNSADNINTRFVAEEHANANWQFNAGGDENGSRPLRSQSQSGNRGRRSPPKTSQPSRDPGVAAGVAAAAAAAAASAAAAGMAARGFTNSGTNTPTGSADPQQQPQKDQQGFDADQWREKIGSEHFVPVQPPRSATSPTRTSRSSKRRPKVHMTKGGSAGLMDDDETTSGEEKSAGAPLNGGGADSDNAMDIDTPMGDAAPMPQANGVRGVPLEPSRPEWRAGDANGFAGAPPAVGLGLNMGGPSAVPPVPPKIPVKEQTRFNTSNVAGSEDTGDLGASFADFNNVEPLAQRPTGLGSFDDLKTTLPFESQAAATPPLDRPHARPSGKVNFPKAPVPPRPPTAFGIPSMTPNKSAWDKYVAEFEAYLREWDVVDAKFLDHMIARQSNAKKLKQRGWSAVTSDQGMEEYYAWLEEDKQVHEKWAAYSSEHHRRVREFMAHKDKMKASL